MKNIERYQDRKPGHVLVLGGSGGIGAEVVRTFVARGARKVTFTYSSKKAEAEVLKEEMEAEGAKVYIAPIDQLDEVGFKQFLEDAVTAQGEEITDAVNAIGWSPNTPLKEQTLEEHRKVMDINLHGPFFTARMIAARMEEKGVKEGSIVLITSTNGINSNSPMSSHYDASKGGLPLHVRNFAYEFSFLPHSIRVNGVAPGWVNTPMNSTLPEAYRQAEFAKIWSKRFAEPYEIAGLIWYVSCGQGSSYINGENYKIDGGY